MQGSLARLPGVLVFLCLVLAPPASAQVASGAPRGLGPMAPPADAPLPLPETAPVPAADPATLPGEGAAPADIPPSPDVPAAGEPVEAVVPDQPGKPQGPRVTVTGLQDIDPAGAGILDESSGGFPAVLYQGSPRPAIVARLAQLPAAPNSPALQALLRRILLSATTPPVGETPADEPSMLAQRLRKLIAGGRVAEAGLLGGQSRRDDRFARQAWSEALLLQGRDEDACGDATSLRQSLNDPFWIKLRAYCQIVEGDTTGASLTLEVMRERAIADDTFVPLAAALADGTKPKVPAKPAPGALQVSILRRAQLPVPATLATWLPARQVFLAGEDPLARLVALERAAFAGLVSTDELVQGYAAASFTPDQQDDPEAAAAKLAPTLANALFFQSVSQRTRPAARAQAFAALIERADAQNRFAVFARLSRELARRMPAVPETAWLAPHVLRVLLYNGDGKQAGPWLTMMTSPTEQATVNALRVHAAIVYPSTENLAALPQALVWLGQEASASGGKGPLAARALREVPLLHALGHTIPPEAQWALTAAPAPAPLPGAAGEALLALSRSAQQQRLGETVLNVLVALGNDGPARAPAAVVARAVDALARVGMRDEARAIAAEAVLGAPLRSSP